MEKFSFTSFRQQFPILASKVNGKPLIYFDNAATTQKPNCVIDSHKNYYQSNNANVHRSSHALSARATVAYENVREKAQKFIHAKTSKEIIWTKGCTEGINLVAQSWGRTRLQPNDEIVLSYSEHHANIVPWQIVAKQTGAKIKVLPLTQTGEIDVAQLEGIIGERTKIVCFAHISNVVGRINPIEEIIRVANKYQALTLVDGAQAIAHLSVDVSALGCDFYVFSAHKMYGPTGVGVLYGKQELLEKMPPYQAGGEMIKTVSFEQTTFNDLPYKFEAGTPNIAGVVALGAAISFVEKQGHRGILEYERQLTQYCFEQLSSVQGLNFIVDEVPDIPVFSFTLAGQHNHDVATALDSVGIAVRSGHHCAMPLMQYLNIDGCIRLSLSAYNSFQEIDFTVQKLQSLSESILTVSDDLSASQPNEIINVDALANRNLAVDDILAMFAKAKSWDSKHREIMMLGKKQLRLPDEDKTELSLISGCESQAWLLCYQEADDLFRFKGDSDAKVIRGLFAIILAAVDNKTAAQISAFDMDSYFAKLGLLQHLSPSRGNGLRAIVQKIQHSIEG
ncbi:SufS family cysteine desulfurase [Colwellia sp. MB3u-70]|uniref:SufS family cysteine desulfurase n=1 Tax=unclassified Colwellia TaxID=196834 RepID=UPI0015F4D212|nr:MULTISPECIES: SufS family cysteine desulfurase [unclassified Colwellia]MBA6290783.1 SufS family cysteine desulfurase [Colwellia sp. MB3u-8]MBA6306211.1 SufS family cysteine desulfurase [Colwellia sp. MB3u-70]